MVTFRNARRNLNFAQVGNDYARGHLYVPVEIQTPNAERPTHLLCYRPAIFFRYLRLIALSFLQLELQGPLTKTVCVKSEIALNFNCLSWRVSCSLTKRPYVPSRLRHIASQQAVMSTGSYLRTS